jgi:hypothetical protein
METAAPTPATPAPEEKKSWFETVVTSTPVLLTVIATFMVGQSSGEMTRAQYFRAVASQNQSKVGDQWGFFQAKRIRGQILEGNSDLLLAQKRDLFSRDTIPDAAQNLVNELRAAEKELNREAAKELTALVADAEKALVSTKAALNPPTDGWQGETHLLKPQNVQAALDALQPKAKKKTTDMKDKKEAKEPDEGKEAIPPEQAALLKEIIGDIKTRKPEGDIAPKVLKITDETLNQAIKEADSCADEVYRRGKSIENVLEEFDALVKQQTALAFEFQRITARLKRSEGLEKRADAIRTLNAKLQGDFKAVRHAYSARRYEDDARSNQDSAYLYEVKVFSSAARSDKHLFRSKLFLFAMLVAQVGVTIATLAIAVKRKSVFWLLAALTGVIAIGFGTYVYLDLWPIPTF